jgi:ABC-type sugar transport system ATPase subunit
VLTAHNLSVRYGAVEALTGVSLSAAAGQVLAVLGDNGAGKSTLMRTLAGAQAPSEGRILLDGVPIAFAGPRAALARGIAAIYQDLALVPRQPVWANVFLGSELTRRVLGLPVLDRRAMRIRAADYLARLRIAMPPPDTEVQHLSGGQRQAVALARALRWDARVVILDEPTAALGVKETAHVLELIRTLRGHGVCVLLVSHNMEQVSQVADRAIVLRRGRKVAETEIPGTTARDLAQLVLTAESA